MSLAASIRSAIGQLRDALGDVPEAATYQARSEVAYNPSLGTVDAEWSDTAINAVFARYSAEQIAAEPGVQPTDVRGILWASDLAAAPAVHDRIARADGSAWEVLGTRTDPVSAIWILQLRQVA